MNSSQISSRPSTPDIFTLNEISQRPHVTTSSNNSFEADTLEQSRVFSGYSFDPIQRQSSVSSDIILDKLRAYLSSDNDEDALAHLQSLDTRTLNVIKGDVYIRAGLQPISKQDAAAIFIQNNPRAQQVQDAVTSIVASLEIIEHSPITEDIRAAVESESIVSEREFEDSEQVENNNFFTSISDCFCKWLSDISNWFCRFFNINPSDDEQDFELSLNEEIAALLNMIDDESSDDDLISASLGLLFERFPDFKAEISRLVIASLREEQRDFSVESFDLDQYIESNTRSDNLTRALRMHLSELQRVSIDEMSA